MTITVNDKELELNFGIEFVHRLDAVGAEKMGKDVADNVGFGCGLTYCVPYILAGDYYILAVLLYTATWQMTKNRPKLVDIENYLDTVEDLDGFRDEVIEELKKSGACARMTNEMIKQMEETQAKVDEANPPKKGTKKSS
ncbi:MAG: tail assembly chaperone [Bacteroidales bacterium]|nr:tail assembly chaperone [Bacteroidales bacterium]